MLLDNGPQGAGGRGPETYKQQVARAAPLLGGYKQRITALRAQAVAADWVALTHERADHLDPDAIPVIARSNLD